MARTYFIIYLSYEDQLKKLTREQRGAILDAMFHYEKTGEVIDLDPVSDMAFSFICSQMERDKKAYNEKCEKNSQNGAKGGRPKKSEKSERFLEKRTVFSESEKSQEKEKGKEKEEYNFIGAGKPPKKEKPQRNIIPPDLEWVKSYCKERQNNVDPKRFFDHYESIGWKIGKQTMKDWQAAVRTWEPRESQEQKATSPAPKSIYREL